MVAHRTSVKRVRVLSLLEGGDRIAAKSENGVRHGVQEIALHDQIFPGCNDRVRIGCLPVLSRRQSMPVPVPAEQVYASLMKKRIFSRSVLRKKFLVAVGSVKCVQTM